MQYKSIARRYGLSARIEALEKDLLSIRGVTGVEFDLNGYLDDIYEVIVIAAYEMDATKGLSKYYEDHGRIQKKLVETARKHGLRRTEDALEDMGAHFYIVFSAAKWNDNREYALFYEYKGREIPVGSEGWVPDRQTANRLMAYHEARAVMKGHDIYMKERIQERLYAPMKRYNGRVVYNKDHCFFNALKAGDYVTQEIADYFTSASSPVCIRPDCTQLGEAAATKVDMVGSHKDVYLTIKKVTEDIWQYCGRCFLGENVERGTYPVYD
jgi:hypothetical protein